MFACHAESESFEFQSNFKIRNCSMCKFYLVFHCWAVNLRTLCKNRIQIQTFKLGRKTKWQRIWFCIFIVEKQRIGTKPLTFPRPFIWTEMCRTKYRATHRCFFFTCVFCVFEYVIFVMNWKWKKKEQYVMVICDIKRMATKRNKSPRENPNILWKSCHAH